MNQMSKVSETFYITGGNVPADALSYVTRDADARLLKCLLAGEFCYILTSRQMGKSSLMTHMVKRLREHNAAPAVLDLSSQGFSLSAEQWFNGLLEQLGRRLKIEDEIEDFCESHPNLSPLQLWQQALRDVVLEVLPGQVVIFIDEIDVVRSLTFSTDEFFAAIRACYNARTEDPTFARLTFCLLGVATPADLIANPKLTPFNIGVRIDLTDFSREEAQVLEHGLGPNSETNRVLMDRIYYWTGGHPYLTQRLCQAVAENDANLTERSVDACAERLFLSSKAQRQDSNLMFVQQRMLPGEEEERVGMLSLYARVLNGKGVADSETAAFVSALKLAGIVQVVSGQLKVRNRIYAQVFGKGWIEENMPGAELRRQREAVAKARWQVGSIAAAILLVMSGLMGWAMLNAYRAEAARKAEAKAKLAYEKQSKEAKRQALLALTAKSEAEKARNAAFAAKSAALSAKNVAEKALKAESHATQAARKSAAEATAQSVRAKAATALAEQQRQKSERTAYIVNMNLIQREWDANNIGHVLKLLEETRNSRFRGFEWGYWNRMCHRELMTLHGDSAVGYSPDGKRIVTGGYDTTAKKGVYRYTAKVWDAAIGRKVLSLNGHTGTVNCVAYSPDGKRIVTGSGDTTAKVWDAISGRELLTFKGHTNQVLSVAFSPDGRRVVTGSWDHTAKVWDVATGQHIVTVPGSTYGLTIGCFSPDGNHIATVGEGLPAKVWDAATGRELLTINSDSGTNSTCICFSPDGTRILIGNSGGSEFSLGDHSGLDDVSSIENSVRGKDVTAKVWDAVTGRELLALKGCTMSVNAVAFSPDGRNILAGVGGFGKPGVAKMWDAQTGEETRTYKGHLQEITAVAFSPDGTQFITASRDEMVKVWDAWNIRRALALDIHHPTSVAFSFDGKRILTGGGARLHLGQVRVWEAQSGQEILALKVKGPIGPVAYSPNGRYIATGSGLYVNGGRYRAAAIVWDAQTGKEILALNMAKKADVTAIAFSPDNHRIVTAGGGTAQIWDAQTGKELLALKFKHGDILSVAFSPDGKRIVTGGYSNTAIVWDATTGHTVLFLNGHTGYVACVAYSPDGRRIVTGSYDTTAKVWDAYTGQVLLTLRGQTSSIQAVAFSPGCQRIATGSENFMSVEDGEAKLWDAQTGRELLTLQGNAASVKSLAFSPDGKNIVTVGFGHAYMWFSDPKGWKDAMSATIEARKHLWIQELVDAKKYAEAVAEYKLALRLYPSLGNAALLGTLGWYEYLAGQVDDAIKSSHDALQKDPTLTHIRLNLGLCYATLDDWSAAQREYDLALKAVPKANLKAGIEDVQTALKKRSTPALEKALVYLQKAGGK